MRKIQAYIIILMTAVMLPTLFAKAEGSYPAPTVIVDNVMPFTVYPNPLTANKLVVNLAFDQPIGDVVFSISNVLGQQLFSYTITSKDFTNGSFSVDLSNQNLEKGIYLMKMSRDDKSSVQKLVVK